MYDYSLFESFLGLSIGLIIVLALFGIAIAVLYVIGLWKLFKKAGKNGWEAIIPFYSTYVLVEISGLNWWYFLIAISGTICNILHIDGISYVTSIASMVVMAFCYYNIAKKMHQSPVGYAVAGAFVSGIVAMIFGFSSKYTWDNNVKVSPNGPIGDDNKDNSSNSSTQVKYCLGCGQKLNDNSSFCTNCGKKVE